MGLSFEFRNVSINRLIIVKSLISYGTVHCMAALAAGDGRLLGAWGPAYWLLRVGEVCALSVASGGP
jgi:hypothetical protein